MAIAMRRAQLDVQFNWIFVLIAGAVILALFFKVANTQRQISEDKAAIRLQNDFDAITTAALQSKDTIQTVQLPSLGLHFDCADCTCMIKFGRFAMPFEDRAIFTPYAVTGPDAKLWTLDWKMPFRITNFLYITNDNVKYYVVSPSATGSSQLADHIKSALPTEENGVTGINTEFITDQDLGSIVYNNENRVVFVLLDGLKAANLFSDTDALKKLYPLKKVDVRAIEVYTTPVTSVEFYKRDPKTADIIDVGGNGYLGDELLFGAIIAQDAEAYTCNLITALQRIQGVGKTAMKRAEMLSSEASLPNSPWAQCGQIYSVIVNGDPETGDPYNLAYDPATAPLATIINGAAAIVKGGPCGSTYVASFGGQNYCNVYILQDAASSLAQQNDKLLTLSCPTVY